MIERKKLKKYIVAGGSIVTIIVGAIVAIIELFEKGL